MKRSYKCEACGEGYTTAIAMFRLKIKCEYDKENFMIGIEKTCLHLNILFQSICGITDIMILFSFLSDLEDREFQFVFVFPLLSKKQKF